MLQYEKHNCEARYVDKVVYCFFPSDASISSDPPQRTLEMKTVRSMQSLAAIHKTSSNNQYTKGFITRIKDELMLSWTVH